MLTLTAIADRPHRLTRRLTTRDGRAFVFRPLDHSDAARLADFLGALSAGTRRFSTFDGYDLPHAQELCDAIARYDKLRLVLEDAASRRIAGLLEFSLALVPSDLARYRAAGLRLAEGADCRFGLTLADDCQNRGLGTLVLPLVLDVARQLGRSRIILWGGVRADNHRAVRYYEKNGFRRVGESAEPDGSRSLDMMLDLSERAAGVNCRGAAGG
ncbi:GNAT family N-acetyltransferase [Kitasatospora sp. NPDC004531]